MAGQSDMSLTWGVPLTTDENAEVQRRFETQQHQDQIVSVLEAVPEYAGLSIDQHARGELVVHWAGTPPDALVNKIAALIPKTATIRYEMVTYSASQLEATRSRLRAFLDTPEGSALGITFLASDEVQNRVVVGIDPYSDRIAQTLATFGESVKVVPERAGEAIACTRDSCPNPQKGGIHIYAAKNPTTDINCTSGFMGRANFNPVPGQWFLLTAGHCISDAGGNGHYWFSGSLNIGSALTFSFSNGADADMGVIKMNTMQFPTNQVFAQGATDIRSITSWVTNPNQTQGSLICRAGYGSDNYLCGGITMVNYTQTVGSTNIDHEYRMSIKSVNGDSGGSMMANSAAMGYASASDMSTWTAYTTIDWGITVTGYKPCRSANNNPCT